MQINFAFERKNFGGIRIASHAARLLSKSAARGQSRQPRFSKKASLLRSYLAAGPLGERFLPGAALPHNYVRDWRNCANHFKPGA